MILLRASALRDDDTVLYVEAEGVPVPDDEVDDYAFKAQSLCAYCSSLKIEVVEELAYHDGGALGAVAGQIWHNSGCKGIHLLDDPILSGEEVDYIVERFGEVVLDFCRHGVEHRNYTCEKYDELRRAILD